MIKKKYSIEEKRHFFEGIETAKEDYVWCAGNKKKIDSCVLSRLGLKDLCRKRNDKNGLSFQNGYLYYFNKKNKKRF